MMPTIYPQVSWNGVRRLILGSKSWSRRTLLQQLEPPPHEVVSADIDEDAVAYKADDVHDMVLQIALAKAKKLMTIPSILKYSPLSTSSLSIPTTPSDNEGDDDDDEEEKEGRVLMICGDAVVKHKGEILGKPTSVQHARQLLNSYKDAPVTTVSSVVVIDVVRKIYWSEIDEAEVYFRQLPNDVVEKVIEDGGMQSAGALRIEMPEVQPYIECIVGDLSAVMGFSQPVLARLVSKILVEDLNGTSL